MTTVAASWVTAVTKGPTVVASQGMSARLSWVSSGISGSSRSGGEKRSQPTAQDSAMVNKPSARGWGMGSRAAMMQNRKGFGGPRLPSLTPDGKDVQLEARAANRPDDAPVLG